MAKLSMHAPTLVRLALISLSLGATTASAQGILAPDGSIHQTKLERACSDALVRFCPELAAMPGQTMNQVICLKPYRTSLTPWCRSAVTTAMK